MAVEFVVAAPAFIILLLLVGAGGQWVSASGEVGAAARDAVRQASLEVNYAGGAQTSVALLANGRQVAASAWAGGAQVVEVRVSCTVRLRAFAVIGIPASETFTDMAAAPLDQFTQRTG
jgi:Flp pilus assembly protein TadG